MAVQNGDTGEHEQIGDAGAIDEAEAIDDADAADVLVGGGELAPGLDDEDVAFAPARARCFARPP